MKVIIDRIEENFAVAELPDGTFSNIPRALVPDAREGDVLKIEIDTETTKQQKTKIKTLFNKLFKD